MRRVWWIGAFVFGVVIAVPAFAVEPNDSVKASSTTNLVPEYLAAPKVKKGIVGVQEYHGGQVFLLPARGFVSREDSKARFQYKEFLAKGSYSRVRSIGIGYSGTGGRYSISNGGGTAHRTSSSRARLKRGSRSFANITNGSRGSFEGGFGSINNQGARSSR